jgi:hypothetical protein
MSNKIDIRAQSRGLVRAGKKQKPRCTHQPPMMVRWFSRAVRQVIVLCPPKFDGFPDSCGASAALVPAPLP